MPTPFVDHVGIRVEHMHAGESLLSLELEPCHFNGNGIVHGGVLFTLADTGMGAALMSTLSPIESCATIEVKINYFRAVVEGPLSCRTEIVHRGRRTASLESSLLRDGKTVAKASGTFAIFARRGGALDTAAEAE